MSKLSPSSAVPDEAALRAWERDYVLHHELERERVKTLPAFQAAAEKSIKSVQGRDGGMNLAWNIDDCTSKWVETYGFEFPEPPVTRPAWANPGYDVRVMDTTVFDGETIISFTGEISVGAGSAKLYQSIYIWADKIEVDTSVTLDEFEETLSFTAAEIDPMIAALTEVRRALMASEIDALLK